jgi:NADH-quinone oxidoreductase subunit F
MMPRRFASFAARLLGPLAILAAASLSISITVVYLQASWRESANRALIDALKEKGKTDAGVQPAFKAERERQRLEAARRRSYYERGGMAILAAGVVFLIWSKWLRPERPLRLELPSIAAKTAVQESPAGGDGAHCPCKRPDPPGPPRPDASEVDVGFVEESLGREGRGPDAAIPVLQAIQHHYRYLPLPALRRVCERSTITPAQIAGVSTFYGQFRHGPVGEHIIRVCEGTACHVSGAVDVSSELRRLLGLAPGQSTDRVGRFTIERVACLGSCSLAPVVTIDDKIYGHVNALAAGGLLDMFLEDEEERRSNGGPAGGGANGREDGSGQKPARSGARPIEFRVGMGSCGVASGAQAVRDALLEEVARAGGGAVVKAVGCAGLCHGEPLVEVVEDGRRAMYGNLTPDDARKVVRRHLIPRGLLRKTAATIDGARLRLVDDEAWKPIAERALDAEAFLKHGVRVVLENCGEIDPLDIREYRERGGFLALAEVLRRSPAEVVEAVRASGLRGRGGAGFPTAVKWDIARQAPGEKKYIIMNGDEGDPGAFMDRAVLEADPFRVLEGMAIAAHAIGADEGFVYVRREYPIAVRHVRAAIIRAEEQGFLGDRILGSPFRLKLHVREGAGAFVCGEETALIRSIEGFRGMPRLRPPFPAQSGLWGRPTVINNVETLACLPWIIRRGPEAFAALGTEKSKGTKVFSLAGKVRRGGLIEVPMGITIRQIVEDIGGGMRDGRKFKAVLVGGPSGGCIPASHADTRVDYEDLARTGAIMGSGGLVVLDDRDCAVEIARYFLHFTQEESCGKCTYCRVGTKRMLEILERICAGKGRPDDLETLEELADRVKRGSLCGLGQTAPNPVLTTLRHFRAEYEAHVREKRCPAAQCKRLIHYFVTERCTGCTLCAQACPAVAIEPRPYLRHLVLDDRCTRCGMCVTACPEEAIDVF